MSDQFDVVVIGSGVGGLTTAARMVLAGLRPLVLEAQDQLGGRFSTIEKDGYKIPTGAVAIEYPGPWQKLVEEELGIDADFRVPNPPVMVRFKRGDVTAGAPAWSFMIKKVAKSAAGLADAVRRAGPDEGRDEGSLTLEQWAKRYTKSKTALSLMQSLSASIFTVNADEVKAHVFFAFLRKTGGYKTIAFAPNGNIAIADAVADEIVRRGGEVRTGWTATEIDIEDGLAVAVRATDPDGLEHRIPARAVVSNIGPVFTANLLARSPVADEFAERVAGLEFTSILVIAFSSTEELLPKAPGFLNFADTERLCSLANLSYLCPELAPPGRKLYTAYSVPRPSIGGHFDEQYERDLFEKDLREKIKGFDKADVILYKVYRTAENPAFRCVPGTNPPVSTPVPNLFEVGDGVLPDGASGTSGCAMSANLASEQLLHAPFAPKL